MKKITNYILIAVLLAISIFSFTSCFNDWDVQREYLKKTMDSIRVEYEGYELTEGGFLDVNYWSEFEYELLGKQVKYSCHEFGREIVHSISYGDKEIAIDNFFLMERCKVYSFLVKDLWLGYKDLKDMPNSDSEYWPNYGLDGEYGPKIFSIGLFENKIFIVAYYYYEQSWDVKYSGYFIPYTLYYYDILNDHVYYCGYYKDITWGNKYFIITKNIFLGENNEKK